MRRLSVVSILSVFCASILLAQPSPLSKEQAKLWDYMKQSWEDDIAKNGKWPAEYTVDSYVWWSDKDPGPRDRDSSIEWNRVTKDHSTILWYELTPMAVVIEGNTAVLMYYSNTLSEDDKGERKRSSSKVTEVLARKGGSWKFVSSTSSSLDAGD